MDVALLLEYGWVLLVLIVLEGLLSADNAAVLAVSVQHLPGEQRKKALTYGLVGAFVMRFGALFLISYIATIWQVQALGALYLLYMALSYLYKTYIKKSPEEDEDEVEEHKKKGKGFWATVIKVEFLDLAFAIDSILAAVALAITLPETPLPQIGGFDGGQFLVVFFGGFIGVVLMRFVATAFTKLLDERPALETAAMLLVGWVGVKLVVFVLSHQNFHTFAEKNNLDFLTFVPEGFAESGTWSAIFWVVMGIIVVLGWIFSGKKKEVQ